jgi:uncharacterized protein (DUF58 family)
MATVATRKPPPTPREAAKRGSLAAKARKERDRERQRETERDAPSHSPSLNAPAPIPTPAPPLDRPSEAGLAERWARFATRFRPPRKLRATREGKWYLGITFGVGLAAVNTGNNLLYLLLGMLLALIVVSGVMSEISLRHLVVVRRLPTRAQVDRPHLVEIEVFNSKKKIPSYAIEVEDLRAGQPADKRCFFLKINPGSAQVAAYRRTPQRRGVDRHVGFRVATRFPFGLFEKSREIGGDGDLVIYPAVDSVRLGAERQSRLAGSSGAIGRGGGDEIAGIRPEREGDDPRDIYWRKSTMPNGRVMRERGTETRPEVTLSLDVKRPTPPPEDFERRFERAIRELASRAVAHIKRGDQVLLITSTGARIKVDRSAGIDPLLRFLALVESVASPANDEGAAPLAPPVRAPAVSGERAIEAAALGKPANSTAAPGAAASLPPEPSDTDASDHPSIAPA